MKKTTSLILVLTMVLSICLTVPAFAADNKGTNELLKVLEEKVETYGYAPTSLDSSYEGKDVLYAAFADFTADGQDELFIAYYINSYTVSIEIWAWNGEKAIKSFDKVGYGSPTKMRSEAFCSGGEHIQEYIALTEDADGKAYVEIRIQEDGEITKKYYTHVLNGWWMSDMDMSRKTKVIWEYYGEVGFNIWTADSIKAVKDLLSNISSDVFSDVKKSAWYYQFVDLAEKNGLMGGIGNGKFDPNGTMTIAQAITMACRIHDNNNGNTANFTLGSPWYQVYVDYAIDNGIINEDDFTDVNKAATRGEMAYIFANAVNKNEITLINDIKQVPDVKDSDKYYEDILLLYRSGVVAGDSGTHYFRKDDNISRAEAATIIVRLALPVERQSFTIK